MQQPYADAEKSDPRSLSVIAKRPVGVGVPRAPVPMRILRSTRPPPRTRSSRADRSTSSVTRVRLNRRLPLPVSSQPARPFGNSLVITARRRPARVTAKVRPEPNSVRDERRATTGPVGPLRTVTTRPGRTCATRVPGDVLFDAGDGNGRATAVRFTGRGFAPARGSARTDRSPASETETRMATARAMRCPTSLGSADHDRDLTGLLLQRARPVQGFGSGKDFGDDGVDVGFGRQVVDDAGAEAEAAADVRVGQRDVAARGDVPKNLSVAVVEGVRCGIRPAEAHRAQFNRSKQLERPFFGYQLSKKCCLSEVVADCGPERGHSVVAQRKP